MRRRLDLHWRTMMTFLTFVAPLAALGLVPGDMENAWDCCVVGDISENTWRLHTQDLVLLVLEKISIHNAEKTFCF